MKATPLISIVRAEFIKTRKSKTMVLLILGALFIPLIRMIIQWTHVTKTAQLNSMPDAFHEHLINSWEPMAYLLFPLGIVLCTSLIVYPEYLNNTWKQMHTAPVSSTQLFLGKYIVILLLLLLFLLLFQLAVLLSIFIPPLFWQSIPFPKSSPDALEWLQCIASYFLAGLPIVAFQFLIAMRMGNIFTVIGTGMIMLITSIFTMQWEHGYFFPFGFPGLEHRTYAVSGVPHYYGWMISEFIIFTIAGLFLFTSKKMKG
jgi:hypothetical protein